VTHCGPFPALWAYKRHGDEMRRHSRSPSNLIDPYTNVCLDLIVDPAKALGLLGLGTDGSCFPC